MSRADLDRLQAELEEYRLRELEGLRTQLAEANALVEHYRSEAHRNAELGQQIAAEAGRERALLKGEVQALRGTSARPERTTFQRQRGN